MIITILSKNTNLIDVISLNDKQLTYSIGKSLVYKSKHDSNINHSIYKLFKLWLDLDPIHCSVILGNSLKKSGEYNATKLLDRFKNRIRSDRLLSNKLKF